MRLVHRLTLLRYGIPSDFVLNSGPEPDGAMALEPVAADTLRGRIVNALKAEAYDTQRGRVDYARLRASPTYTEYCQCARRLQSFDPVALGSREERLAFWINLYNALIVDAVIQFEVKHSVGEVPGFFWRAAYNIGGQRYCTFDIEYGILRANAPHPAIPGPHFGPRDPRRPYSLDRLDPRIHFALVCAARSCPPIAVYDAAHIDGQLDIAARTFINHGGVEIDRATGQVRLSQIFRWYGPDFGGHALALGDTCACAPGLPACPRPADAGRGCGCRPRGAGKRPVLEFIAAHLADEADRDYLLRGKPAIRFLPYDWSLNS